MTVEEIEAFFLDHGDPIFEQIQEADTEGEAVVLAGQALDALHPNGFRADTQKLIVAVRNIRNA